MKKDEEFKSSITNEVIKVVLNFFFYEKISHTLGAQKALKALKALKAIKDTKPFGQKHKNANRRISDYFPLRCVLGTFFFFLFACKRLCFLVVVKFLNKRV